jgi:hypothetical protein
MTFLRMSLSAAVVLVSVSGLTACGGNKKTKDAASSHEQPAKGASGGALETCTPTLVKGMTDYQQEVVQMAASPAAMRALGFKLPGKESMITPDDKDTFKKIKKCMVEFKYTTADGQKKSAQCVEFSRPDCTNAMVANLRVLSLQYKKQLPPCSTCDTKWALKKNAYAEPMVKITNLILKIENQIQAAEKSIFKKDAKNAQGHLKEVKTILSECTTAIDELKGTPEEYQQTALLREVSTMKKMAQVIEERLKN